MFLPLHLEITEFRFVHDTSQKLSVVPHEPLYCLCNSFPFVHCYSSSPGEDQRLHIYSEELYDTQLRLNLSYTTISVLLYVYSLNI